MNKHPGRTYLRETSTIRSDIYKYLQRHDRATTRQIIAALPGRNAMTIRSKLSSMVAEGAVLRDDRYYPSRYSAGRLRTAWRHAGPGGSDMVAESACATVVGV